MLTSCPPCRSKCSPPAISNVAYGKSVSTTLDNTYSRNIPQIVDGVLTSGEWSSSSVSGQFEIDFGGLYWISEVKLYWAGSWGANTNNFAVELSDDSLTSTVYQTTTAPIVDDRIDSLDLTSLGTARQATKITLKVWERGDNGYALYELQAFGYALEGPVG